MIIPWSHDSGQLQRRPLVTYAIILACIAVFLGTTGLGNPLRKQARSELQEAYSYWEAHPYLEPPSRLVTFYGDPGAAARAKVRAAMAAGKVEPIPDAVFQVQQRRLQELVSRADGMLHQHPWYRFGLVPSHLRAQGFLGYMFLHSGWMHLAGNMLFLFLTGPFIEDRWGRFWYLLFYLSAGVVGAGLYVFHNPSADGPLVGASGAIAGCMGAFLVIYWRTNIKFFYWLGLFFGNFRAPAWLMLPLWFAGELASAATDAPGGVAYWAHVGGFGFGALCALAVRACGGKARIGTTDSGAAMAAEGTAPWEPQSQLPPQEAGSAELGEAIRRGQRARALAAWRALMDEGDAAGIPAPLLLRLAGWLREAGCPGPAGAVLRTALPGSDAATAARIAKVARRFDPVVSLRAARRALALGGLDAEEQQVLEHVLPGLCDAVAASPVILVPDDAPVERRREPAVSTSAVWNAEDFDSSAIELPDEEPAGEEEEGSLDALYASLVGGPEETPVGAGSEPGAVPLEAPSLFGNPPAGLPADLTGPVEDPIQREGEEWQPTSTAAAGLEGPDAALERTQALLPVPDAEEEKAPAPPPRRTLQVRAGVPLALEAAHLRLTLQGRGPSRLPLARIDAVAVAGVSGLGRGERAVLLIDLVLGWTGPGPLRVVRLRSDRFDPRELVAGGTGSPLQALHTLAAELVRRARAIPLPKGMDPSEPFRIFSDLAAYEGEVLGTSRASRAE